MGKLSFDGEQLAGVRSLSHSKSSLKRSRRRPISISMYRPSKSADYPDESRRKRVKFAGTADICELKGNLDGPSLQNEDDGAKTSEFKSFKRLLENTAHKHYSDKVFADHPNLKNDMTRYSKEASSNPVLCKSVVRGPSLLIQNVPSVAQARSPRFPKVTSATPLFHPAPEIVGETDGGHSEIIGLRHEDSGTFSGKRANLLRLAAGTRSQNVDDFLLNRSDFILEILERLGLRRDSNKRGELQKSEQKTLDHQFPASSKWSDHIVEFYDTSQENPRTYEPRQSVNLLTWDDTKIQPFQCKHSSPEACFENSVWKSGLFNDKGETLLPDFEISASPIGFRDEFDTTQVEFFQTDSRFNSASDRKDLHEFYITRKPTNTWNSNAEIDCMEIPCAFQADCILPKACKSERYLPEEALVPYINESSASMGIAFPSLERDVAEHELPEHNFFVLEEVDNYPTILHDFIGFQDEIGRSSSTDVHRRRGLSSLQSCSFDIMLRGLARRMKLDVAGYPSPTLLPGSSMYSDSRLSAARQSGCENDIDFLGAPNDFPINITVLERDEDFEFFHDRLSY